LARLRGDLGRFKNDFQVLGTHLANAKSKYDDSEKRLGRVADRLTIIGGEQPEELLEEKTPDDNSEKDLD
jgi:DNA recombination protein RmuC